MNARFWIWVNDASVKLTVRRGQVLRWFKSEQTEEGWSSEERIYEEADGFVVRTLISDGRDCDGRLRQGFQDVAAIKDLPVKSSEKEFPVWQEVGSGVYDEYAQAANY